MTKFLIAGIQRSGTTYIRRCLDSHSMIRCHGEIFQKLSPDPDGYYEFVAASLQRRVGHFVYRAVVVNRYLDYLSSVNTKPFVGFKLMRSQVKHIPYRFPMLLSKIKKGDFKVINIIRRNVLKTHLSRLSTQVSGRYHAKSDVEVTKLKIDTSRLIFNLDTIRTENEWWQQVLSGTNCIIVEYENFVADKETESRRILEHIGVDRYEEMSSANRKINPDDISQLVENYAELEAVLLKSQYAFCL